MSQLFAWGGQSIGVSASTSVLPMNTQDWSISFRMDWLDLLAVQGTLKSVLQHYTHSQYCCEDWSINQDICCSSMFFCDICRKDSVSWQIQKYFHQLTFSLSALNELKPFLRVLHFCRFCDFPASLHQMPLNSLHPYTLFSGKIYDNSWRITSTRKTGSDWE